MNGPTPVGGLFAPGLLLMCLCGRPMVMTARETVGIFGDDMFEVPQHGQAVVVRRCDRCNTQTEIIFNA